MTFPSKKKHPLYQHIHSFSRHFICHHNNTFNRWNSVQWLNEPDRFGYCPVILINHDDCPIFFWYKWIFWIMTPYVVMIIAIFIFACVNITCLFMYVCTTYLTYGQLIFPCHRYAHTHTHQGQLTKKWWWWWSSHFLNSHFRKKNYFLPD